MTSVFVLDGEDLRVTSFIGFDLPDDLQITALLSTGTSLHNAVVQQGSSPLPVAVLAGHETDYGVIAVLRALRASHAQVTFIEPDDSAHTVIVQSLDVHRVSPTTFLWEWGMTLLEIAEPGSGA